MSSVPDHRRSGGYGLGLRRDRLAAALTQEELARRSGLSVRAISDLERGRTGEPRPSTRRRIAEVLSPANAGGVADNRPAGSGRLAQLPADVADFCGRGEELDRLIGLLEGPTAGAASAVAVAVVSGAGGIGKTTLALRAAHLAAPLFPDGQLYLNLQGSGPQSVTPAEALARFLRDLGMTPAAVPPDEGERAARYRSLTAGMRLLITLDDARDAAQVRSLIPGSGGCAVLVTSRNSLASLEAARVLDLGALPESDAAALFTTTVGKARAAAEPEAVRNVIAACAGLPLAVRIAAARLVARPTWTIAALVRRLSDERSRLDELEVGDLAVRASFLMSYTSLPADQHVGEQSSRRAFRLLSLAEGADVSLPAAAALLRIDAASAGRNLERLVDAHLLQSSAPGRYLLHDLLRVYSAERVIEEEDEPARNAAVRRMLLWYLQTAAAACRVINPNRGHLSLSRAPGDAVPLRFGGYDDALAWLEAEHANLVICVGQAARHGEHEITWQLVISLWDLFSLRGSFTESVVAHETALTSARLLGDRNAERYVLGHLGEAYLNTGRLREALGSQQDALLIVRDQGEPKNVGAALVNMGFIQIELGQVNQALQAMQEALKIFEHAGYDTGVGHVRLGLAKIHCRRDRPAEALSCYEQAGQIFRKTGDIATLSETLAEIAALHAGQGQLGAAIESAGEALDLSRQCGSRHNEAQALAVLGRAHRERSEPELARTCWLTALAICTDLGDPQADELAAELQGLSSP